MNEQHSTKKYRDIRNARRRKRRLEKHAGIDWVDPEKGYGKVRGEQALWRAVILQMLEDATSQSKKPQDKFAKLQARNWLEGRHPDFAIVCDLAGFDLQYARKQIKKALLNQHQWRRSSVKAKPEKPYETKSQDNHQKYSQEQIAAKAVILPFQLPMQQTA